MLVQGKKHKVAGSLEGVSSEDRQNSKSHSDSLSGASSEGQSCHDLSGW